MKTSAKTGLDCKRPLLDWRPDGRLTALIIARLWTLHFLSAVGVVATCCKHTFAPQPVCNRCLGKACHEPATTDSGGSCWSHDHCRQPMGCSHIGCPSYGNPTGLGAIPSPRSHAGRPPRAAFIIYMCPSSVVLTTCPFFPLSP